MYVYKITNAVNGKIYIGQTMQRFQKRFIDHLYEAFVVKRKSKLYTAMRKHGREAFSVSLLEELFPPATIDDLNAAEERWVSHYRSVDDGYNLHPGGKNKPCHPETKLKISATLKGRPFKNRWTGGNRMPRTDAQKAFLSAKIKGRPNTVLFKKVQCNETGVIYDSVNAAAAAHGCNRITISSLLKSGKKGGKLGTKGFSFRYAVR